MHGPPQICDCHLIRNEDTPASIATGPNSTIWTIPNKCRECKRFPDTRIYDLPLGMSVNPQHTALRHPYLTRIPLEHIRSHGGDGAAPSHRHGVAILCLSSYSEEVLAWCARAAIAPKGYLWPSHHKKTPCRGNMAVAVSHRTDCLRTSPYSTREHHRQRTTVPSLPSIQDRFVDPNTIRSSSRCGKRGTLIWTIINTTTLLDCISTFRLAIQNFVFSVRIYGILYILTWTNTVVSERSRSSRS